MKWYIYALQRYAQFTGRSQRKEYWYFFLFTFIFSLILGFIENLTGIVDESSGWGFLTGIFFLAMFIPTIAVTVRRLHDTGRTGWWALLPLVPIVGGIALLVLCALDSEPGSNRFGPNPKGVRDYPTPERDASVTTRKIPDDPPSSIPRPDEPDSPSESSPSVGDSPSASTCPKCGSPGWDESESCSICGYSVLRILSFVKEDGELIPVGKLKKKLNQNWAKQQFGEDGIFWDRSWQFSVEPNDQSWVFIPNTSAVNVTLVDGKVITDLLALAVGMRLSVGNSIEGIEKTPITISLTG